MKTAQLPARTFCTFGREFSRLWQETVHRQALTTGHRFGRALQRRHGLVLPAVACKTQGPAGGAVSEGGQSAVIRRLCRVTDMSRRPPIG